VHRADEIGKVMTLNRRLSGVVPFPTEARPPMPSGRTAVTGSWDGGPTKTISTEDRARPRLMKDTLLDGCLKQLRGLLGYGL
jgi:hypothetical protein